MLSYQKFMGAGFPIFQRHYGASLEPLSRTQSARKRALRFLTLVCSPKYGFSAEAHSDQDGSKSVFGIPTSYDSALLLPILTDEGICPEVADSLAHVLRSSRRDNGNWNFFIREPDAEADLFPDDVDDTSCPLMALYLTDQINVQELAAQCGQMIRHAIKSEDGVLTTWLRMGPERRIVHDKYLRVPKICVGCLVNCLWLFAHANMETWQELRPSVEYIADHLPILRQQQVGDTTVPGMSYYINRFVVYFFLSRLLQRSEYCRDLLGRDFEKVIVAELVEFDGDDARGADALNIAGLILAAITLKLHVAGSPVTEALVRNRCVALVKTLLRLQDEDGSFPKGVIYKWNNCGYYGGSRAYSSAMALHAIGRVEREILIEPL
ncbi:hypothetical protein HIM_06212 [Hirsutella minnesotensis 3608]|uniref:Uncharacterized protein n=1 Tax=Hirsutella minnesotensis 3608 TaxID=1043627 RepID=A0A0F7ZZK9_9HYPO|nr:hypothetical protein HIM_06212 [Hirsutella minnesotensis 3608]